MISRTSTIEIAIFFCFVLFVCLFVSLKLILLTFFAYIEQHSKENRFVINSYVLIIPNYIVPKALLFGFRGP